VKFALLVATWESLEGMGNHQDDVLPLFVNLNTQNKQKLPMSRGANNSTCGDKVVRWLMGWCDNRSLFWEGASCYLPCGLICSKFTDSLAFVVTQGEAVVASRAV